MSIINPDGFRFFYASDIATILVESDRVDQYVDYINKNNIKSVSVRLFDEYKRIDIDFLNKCPDIEYLGLDSPLVSDYSPLHSLKHLKWLRIDFPKSNLDLAQLPALEELHLYQYKHIRNLDKCTALKKLDISFYNPPGKNLLELSGLNDLTSLRIYRSNASSFKGLGELKHLEHIFFYNFANLHFIDELEKISDTLTVLVFEGCKRIENFDYLACLKKLKVLKFANCGNIRDIKFFKQMPNLKAFAFVDTKIDDGDLSPCVGLEYVGFFNSGRYSLKQEDFKNDNISSEIDALMKLP
jgi:protein phosphatase 1 regulatory subunit 7